MFKAICSINKVDIWCLENFKIAFLRLFFKILEQKTDVNNNQYPRKWKIYLRVDHVQFVNKRVPTKQTLHRKVKLQVLQRNYSDQKEVHFAVHSLLFSNMASPSVSNFFNWSTFYTFLFFKRTFIIYYLFSFSQVLVLSLYFR